MKTSTLNKKSIKELTSQQGKADIVVSIYIPTHPQSTPSHVNADRIRFKNAIQTMEAQLQHQDVDKKQQERFKKQVSKLYQNSEFWRGQDKGLSVFATSQKLWVFSLPIEVDSLTFVGEQFILTPLIVVMDMFPSCYVLSLNTNEPKLFKASVQDFFEVPVPKMPGELRQALRISGYEQEQQHHSYSNGNVTVFHGHGAAKDGKEIEVTNYMRLVDKALQSAEVLEQDSELLLAGTESQASLFRQVSNIKQLSPTTISGNFEGGEMTLQQIVQNHLRTTIEEKITAFEQQHIGSSPLSKRSYSTPELLQSTASQGNIKTLAVSLLDKTRDSVRASSSKINKLALDIERSTLVSLETLVQEVFSKSGRVIAVYPETINSRGVHALLRHTVADA